MQQLHASRGLLLENLGLVRLIDGCVEAGIDGEAQIVQFLGQIPGQRSLTASDQDTLARGRYLQREKVIFNGSFL